MKKNKFNVLKTQKQAIPKKIEFSTYKRVIEQHPQKEIRRAAYKEYEKAKSARGKYEAQVALGVRKSEGRERIERIAGKLKKIASRALDAKLHNRPIIKKSNFGISLSRLGAYG